MCNEGKDDAAIGALIGRRTNRNRYGRQMVRMERACIAVGFAGTHVEQHTVLGCAVH
jgi:hypothetical protein